jgi:aminodeoxychorismate synthase component I
MHPPPVQIALAMFDRPIEPIQWLQIVEAMHLRPGFWWLDSALPDARLGRYSFVGTNPYLRLQARGSDIEIEVWRDIRPGFSIGTRQIQGDPIDLARSLFPEMDSCVYSTREPRSSKGVATPVWRESANLETELELPFLGGAVGYFGYELASTLEKKLCFENADDLGLPDLSLAFVDQLLAFDHASHRLWTVGLGFEEVGSAKVCDAGQSSIRRSRKIVDALSIQVDQALSLAKGKVSLATSQPTFRASAGLKYDSTTDANGYSKSVDEILQKIESGKVYQANFSQRLTVEAAIDPWEIYQALRRHNPSPFGGYLALSDAAILSSSPERFLQLDRKRRVESRPIKGTRPRGIDREADLRLSEELASSPKDRAENLMIVDLVRNDLGRVCLPGSIEVPELMAIEAYAKVFQMVSTVTGTLDPERDAFDLLRGAFPPGSMTGAPKLAAIALLETLEEVKRGVYAGALGYLDLRGGLDLSVVIRTIIWQDGRAYLHVGGGVVSDSNPTAEYLESLDKARAPLAALEDALGLETT